MEVVWSPTKYVRFSATAFPARGVIDAYADKHITVFHCFCDQYRILYIAYRCAVRNLWLREGGREGGEGGSNGTQLCVVCRWIVSNDVVD